MILTSKQLFPAAMAIAVAVFLSACASRPSLEVRYQLPSSSTALTGERVSLAVSDRRNNDSFLSNNAKNSIENFNDTFSLIVLRDDGSQNLIGVYDLDSLLKEIFKQRLENEGLQVMSTADSANTDLEIQLTAFKLDLVDRKWVLLMSYRAQLSDSSGVIAKESVNGSAERLRVMGKGGAEKILGELVTDMANKLDVTKLLHHTR